MKVISIALAQIDYTGMKKLLLVVPLSVITLLVFAQNTVSLEDIQPGRFDQGKMWTFENPPIDYFEEAYGFRPSQEWMDDVRRSALRFSSWCSASFVSENGLIMTNHHCSRSVTASVMKPDENFDENGFYAPTLEDERRVPDLYVDQLFLVADITDEVKALTDISGDSAIQVVKARYSDQPEWKDLVLETRAFYSGGKYSLYGFKRYTDIRLVLYPELAIGFFGGDPDNFTYPRYNLDFTFFRAYDESGNPLKPPYYYPFNPQGAAEDEPVFIIGNPGSTGRYKTMSQLYFQRDISAPLIVSYLKNRFDILMKAAEDIEDIYVKDSVTNIAFSLSNSHKAYSGRLKGLNDPYLMTKKEKKEQQVRSNLQLETDDPWKGVEENMQVARAVYPDVLLLSPNAIKGKVNQVNHKLLAYQQALESEDEEAVEKTKSEIQDLLDGFDYNLERALFAIQLDEITQFSTSWYIGELMNGKSGYDRATEVMSESILLENPDKFFKLKSGKLDKEPLMQFANTFPAKYRESSGKYGMVNRENSGLEEQIMNLQFQLSGVSSPPDATFSLRIADGRVKGYSYNGTEAPVKTTFFGLYDRYYSNDGEFPWNLPERWQNPPMDMLKAPINFVCTADIIGGNSGSPVINQNKEVVGLVFDGNIESLPGYFIFDDTYNRTVSVHAGGIAAAVKYIYNADRLLKELNAE